MPPKCTLSYHADSTKHVYSKAYPYYITHTHTLPSRVTDKYLISFVEGN